MSRYSYPIADVNPSQDEFEQPVPLHPLTPVVKLPHVAVPPYVQLSDRAEISGFTRTTHLIPAAFPRNLPSASPLRSTSSHAVSSCIDDAIASLGISRRDFEQRRNEGRKDASDQVQWNYVDRYVPQVSRNIHKNGVTLFLSHSAGFYRQIWEPMLQHLLSGPSAAMICEIWSFEAVQHGDSALINDEAQRDIVDWNDLSRDILNFIINYLPLKPWENLNTILNPVPLTDRFKRDGKLVGIGHSFGGTVLARAVIEAPQFFDALILVEPMIFSPQFKDSAQDGFKALNYLLRITLQKQPTFSSREEAEQYIRRYPVAVRWHPGVHENFLKYGFAPCPNGSGVRLKTRPFDEAAVTYGWRSGHEVWSAIAGLDPRVALHWIMSGKGAAWTGGRAITRQTVWRRPQNASNVLIPDAGHSIPQERPDALAAHISAFLNKRYQYQRGREANPLLNMNSLQALLPWLSPTPKL